MPRNNSLRGSLSIAKNLVNNVWSFFKTSLHVTSDVSEITMGAFQRAGISLYDQILTESRKLEIRLPKWIVLRLHAWISVQYCMLLLYIVGMGVLWGMILVIVPNKNSDHIELIDALFNSMSAVTGSGLATVFMSSLSTFQLFVLMLLCLVGGKVFTTYLELRFRTIAGRRKRRFLVEEEDINGGDSHVLDLYEFNAKKNEVERSSSTVGSQKMIYETELSPGLFRRRKLTIYKPYRSDGDVLAPIKLQFDYKPYRSDADVLAPIRLQFEDHCAHDCGFGALFEKKNAQENQEIENKERFAENDERVLKYLGRIVLTYWAGIQLSGILLAGIYLAATKSARAPVQDSSVNFVFFAVFMTISHFANAGYAPINAGMTPFTKNLGLLLIFGVQMLLGNTMFPVALRSVIWTGRAWRKDQDRGELLRAMLGSPGRFCPYLYTKKQTRWLVMVSLGCLIFLVSLICGTMWENKVMNGLSPREKIVNAVFQTISCRHTGVNVWNLGDWSPTVLYAFILIMYVRGQPVYSSGNDNTQDPDDDKISFQFRNFLFHYSIFVAVAVLLICIIENDNINSDPLNFSILNIVLEVVSAFMNVGLSVGYSCNLRPESGSCVDVPYSFCGKWNSASKFVLIIAMIVGRLC